MSTSLIERKVDRDSLSIRIDYFDEGSTIAGRSSYLNAETFMNTPNPGAKAVEYILRAIAESVSGII